MNKHLNLINVIIVNWNGEEYIRNCLDSLRKQAAPEYSTILVDNGSYDGSLEQVRESYTEVQIIPLEKNFGFAIGNNIALKEISTEYVALLNNDAMPDKHWLSNLVGALERHPEAGLCCLEDAFLSQS
jgi:hypothetical protein